MSAHTYVVFGAEVHYCGSVVELYGYISAVALSLIEGGIRLGLVFTLNAVAVLEDICCDSGIFDSTAVKYISYSEIAVKLIFQTRFGGICT